MYDELEITEDRNEWQKKIAFDSLAASISQFEITTEIGVKNFAATLDWQKEQYGLEDSRIRELHRDALIEQAREFDITSADGMFKYNTTFNETVRQFGLTFKQSQSIQNAALKIQQEKHATDEIGRTISIQLQLSLRHI